MPWQETDPMAERLQFIAAYLNQGYSMTELCERFGIRRNTGYKWVRRYTEQGLAGLQEKSRAPNRCPRRMSEEVEVGLLEAKQAHPHWGARKILPYLARRRPDLDLPAPSTAGELFQRAGLCQARKRRRGHRHPGASPLQAEAPNAVWTADCKGQFRTGDGCYCYPLTVADAYSRFLLSCSARLSTKQVEARPLFERLFREYGLPDAIRTDNGAPFATPAFCGRSKLSVWWLKLGIRHQRIEPGRPEQNGRHGRMHRPLKAEATRPPEHHQSAQQARFDRFCREYNEERPHDALNYRTPASL
jgi:putative transposase